MTPFNRYRSPALPELSPATCAILETVWTDDYESFGLISPEEDAEAFALVDSLQLLVNHSGVRVLTDGEIQRWKDDGWHNSEDGDSDHDVVVLLAEYGVFEILDQLFHAFTDAAEG